MCNLESTNNGKAMGRGQEHGQAQLGDFSSLLKADELKKNADPMILGNINGLSFV